MIDLQTLRKRKEPKTFVHEFDLLEELKTEESETIGRHYITPAGKYPSVTTFLGAFDKGDWLEAWQKKMGGPEAAEKELRRCGDRGTGVHLSIENLLLNRPDTSPAGKYLPMYKQIEPFIREHVQKVHAIEGCLWSSKLRLAGRVDCVATVKGLRSIVDWKTSNNLKKNDWIENYFLQCHAYARMYEERTGYRIESAHICIAVENEIKPQIIQFDPNAFRRKFDDKLKEFDEKHRLSNNEEGMLSEFFG